MNPIVGFSRAFCALAVSFVLVNAVSTRAVERQTLPGHVPGAVATLSPVDRLASTNHLKLAITEIDFTRVANRGFEVQWTTNFSNHNQWQPLDVPGNEPVFAVTSSAMRVQDTLTNAPTKFYRLRIFEP
jgi:hypothetical protein